MHQCCAVGCNNAGVHLFPKDKNLRKQWVTAIRRKDFKATRSSRLCTEHFKEDDYITEGIQSGIKLTRRVLKRGVVPSLFFWNKQNETIIQNTEWVSQPDVCRCCMEASGACDMLTAYVNDAGDNEIYNDIIKDTFGIELSFEDLNKSHFICGLCLKYLLDAYKFKKQILEAEKKFVSYINGKQEEEVTIKIESYSETDTCSEFGDEINEDERMSIEEGTDKNNKEIQSVEKNQEICEPKTQKVKQISHRTRMKQTCEVILKYTTGCPFRHRRSWFQCFFCQQQYMDISSLRLHMEEHDNIDEELKAKKAYPISLLVDTSIFECQICQINLTDINKMQEHFSKLHKRVIYKECVTEFKLDSSSYNCHLCEKKFHVFRALTTHMNIHYTNFICDECGKSFINAKKLKVHKRTHIFGEFSCKLCCKVFLKQSSLDNHMQSHSKCVLKCQICFEPMKHYNDRVKHMSLVHNITHKFTCPFCYREFYIKQYLATHIRKMHGNRNKKCVECGMVFITSNDLMKHKQKHMGVKFTCVVCNKSYARSYTLKEHMRTHGDKKFC